MMQIRPNKKFWDHFLMRTQNLLGIVLSIAALTAMIVLWGNIPTRLASAETKNIEQDATINQMMLQMTKLTSGMDYTVKTLDEIKVDIRSH